MYIECRKRGEVDDVSSIKQGKRKKPTNTYMIKDICSYRQLAKIFEGISYKDLV